MSNNICRWHNLRAAPTWTGSCGIIVNDELMKKLGGFAFFHYCPSCGKMIEVLC